MNIFAWFIFVLFALELSFRLQRLGRNKYPVIREVSAADDAWYVFCCIVIGGWAAFEI